MFLSNYRPCHTPHLTLLRNKNIPPDQFRSRTVICRSVDIGESLVQGSQLLGKSIILFTMFYTTMNWWGLKRAREEYEKKNKK